MNIPEESTLLRIFVGESDKHEHVPLYEAIVLKARAAHLERLVYEGLRIERAA